MAMSILFLCGHGAICGCLLDAVGDYVVTVLVLDSEADLGTFGTGPFGSDGAMDFLDELAGRSAGQRREALEGMFSQVREHPGLLWREFFPDEVVAAAAIAAASMPGGEGIRRDLAGCVDDVHAVLLPAPDRELAASALQALQFVAGPDGPWHSNWVSPRDAAKARQATDQLAAILGGRDQEVPSGY